MPDLSSAGASCRGMSGGGVGRVAGIAAAVIGFVILSPVILLVVLAIVVEDGKPVFFSQWRLGRQGQPFVLYKFRKFHNDDRGHGAALTVKNDPRLTRIGRLLERTKFDELPQLWNVMRGDMALVGPRPESLYFVECFTAEFRPILEHPPGLFGPSQALFRNECAMYPEGCDTEAHYRMILFPAKARIDLAYYRSRTVAGDLKWLLRSIVSIFVHIRLTESRRERTGERRTEPADAPGKTATMASR